MKQKVFFKGLLLSLMLTLSMDASAYDFVVDNIYYNRLTESTCAVTYEVYGAVGTYSGEVQIPSQVTYEGVEYRVVTIANRAFEKCSELTQISLPQSLEEIGTSAFSGCTSLTTITVPQSVTKIGNEAFRSCTQLTSVNIPNGVTSIGKYTFMSCVKLENLKIHENISKIHSTAFLQCWKLANIEIAAGNVKYEAVNGAIYDKEENALFAYPSARGHVTIPDGVSAIGTEAFHSCNHLTGVSIPESVTDIGTNAFYECYELVQVTLPKALTSIANYAFYRCKSLTDIKVPENVTSIGGYAFANCVELVSIEIPQGVTSIKNTSFRGCTKLTNIQIAAENSTYEAIGGIICLKNDKTLFCWPAASGAISIPEGIERIADNAFAGNTDLTRVSLPVTLTYIGDNAFSKCKDISSIYCFNPQPPVFYDSNEFARDIFNTCTLYVPMGCKEKYQTTSYWLQFANIQEFDPTAIKDVNGVADGAKVKAVYSLDGKRVESTKSGNAYIIQYQDGSSKKIIR